MLKIREKFFFTYGQSLIEVIVAVAIFVIIAGGAVVVVLGALSSSRLGEEETQATFYAAEGLEAIGSIRNKGWENLVNGEYGVAKTSGEWVFSGTSDLNGAGEKFTRVVSVSDAYRGVGGNITESSGVVDSDTKKITSTVSWDFTLKRANSVQMTKYFTNWQESINMTCARFCSLRTYSNGICRKNAGACKSRGEINELEGDQYCTFVIDQTTCCCVP